MGRSPCCEKSGLKKGPWTPEEDQKLLSYMEEHGHGCWRALPAKAGLQRCGKSCRLRWTNYLRPDIKRGKFSAQEEQTIIQLHALLGNRWSAIASHLPKRTDNEIKNFWNTHLKKRLAKMGIDPVTHKPRCDALSTADAHASRAASNLSHMAQWESARLEAEARLVRESKLLRHPPSTTAGPAPSSTATSTPPFQLPPLSSAAASSPLPIDLESPTSTLSFSAGRILTAGGLGLVGQHGGQILDVGGEGRGEETTEGDQEVDWKCFPKAMQLLDTTRDHRCESFVGFAAADCSTAFGGADSVSPWLHESSSSSLKSTGPAAAPAAAAACHLGDGFTDMMLLNTTSDDVDRSSSPDVGGARKLGSGAGEDEEEKYKNYWNSILNLVSSVPASNPPDCVLV